MLLYIFLAMGLLMITIIYLLSKATHHYEQQEKALVRPILSSLPKPGNNALSEVSLVRYAMPDNEEEGVEYIRNNASICVKVTIRQKRCCDKKWQTNLLVFNRLRPGEEIELGYAGHGISDDSLISAEHTIVTAEYL